MTPRAQVTLRDAKGNLYTATCDLPQLQQHEDFSGAILVHVGSWWPQSMDVNPQTTKMERRKDDRRAPPIHCVLEK